MNESKIRALVALAYSDGFFDSRELYIINQKAKELGVQNETILNIIRSPEKEDFISPVTNIEKLEFMYSLMQIIYADKIVEDAEKSMFFIYLNKLEFSIDAHEELYNMMLDGVEKEIKFDEFITKFF